MPNRSISLQETHSGAGLEELKEEVVDECVDDQADEADVDDDVKTPKTPRPTRKGFPSLSLINETSPNPIYT